MWQSPISHSFSYKASQDSMYGLLWNRLPWIQVVNPARLFLLPLAVASEVILWLFSLQKKLLLQRLLKVYALKSSNLMFRVTHFTIYFSLRFPQMQNFLCLFSVFFHLCKQCVLLQVPVAGWRVEPVRSGPTGARGRTGTAGRAGQERRTGPYGCPD